VAAERVIAFGALSVAVTAYKSAGFGGTISAPAGSDSAAGQNLLAKYFPSSSANPTNLVYKLSTPAWEDPAVIATATATATVAAFKAVTVNTAPTSNTWDWVMSGLAAMANGQATFTAAQGTAGAKANYYLPGAVLWAPGGNAYTFDISNALSRVP